MKIESDLITLEEIEAEGLRFAVPIYQRLYVWGEDQVKTLMEDLLAAFEEKRGLFFLGGTLVVERPASDGQESVLELIDGQQRFTTLWLISLVWRHKLEPFLGVRNGDRLQPRLSFDIREEVNRFFRDRFCGPAEKAADYAGDSEGTAAIHNALALIRSFMDDRERVIDPEGFTDFVRQKVKLVLTRVPAKTDLNKLFEVINNRGIQLQHHEILKARMLDALESPKRPRYACLWDACAGMGDYVERNLRKLTGIKVADFFDNDMSGTDLEALARASTVLEILAPESRKDQESAPLSLEAILTSAESFDEGSSNDETETETDRVRSIFGFPMFLQHVLRVWLHRKRRFDLPRILDRELLSLFAEHFFFARGDENELATDARSFIELLWELRYLFDKHIIKWVDRGEEEQHLIRKLRKSSDSNSLSRDTEETEAIREFSLLQSMLYHSQQITTQYWITPLLAYLHGGSGDVADYATFLRHLDNHLLCTKDARSLPKRTWDFLENPRHRNTLDCEILRDSLGTGFPHYWFYKLEFVLWFSERESKQDSRWKEFRFTSKNSVEHISPQNPQEVDLHRVENDDVRDGFGNLALVSRSVNSEYGNLPFIEKRARFETRNAGRLDSLKMALVYESERWSDEAALKHRDAMIAYFERYFGHSSVPLGK